MSDPLAVRAEILKLARLLRRDPGELEYLEQAGAADVRLLRDQVTEVMFTAHEQALSRLAAASKLLPVRIVAVIGERAFGPVLAARITGLIDPSRAVEMANTMPIAFLADVAAELDPRRASDVISRIPAQRIAEIVRELMRREEYVTMGRFVGHLEDEAIRAALSVMDDRGLLRVAFVLEEKGGLNHLMDLLPRERLDTVIDAAVHANLWPEVLDLLSHVSEPRRAELVAGSAALDDGAVVSLVSAAAENSLWLELLPLVHVLPDDSRQKLIREVRRLDPAQRELLEAEINRER